MPDRARAYWQQHGRSKKWIQQRIMGQDDEVEGEDEYAILTNIIHQEWNGVEES